MCPKIYVQDDYGGFVWNTKTNGQTGIAQQSISWGIWDYSDSAKGGTNQK